MAAIASALAAFAGCGDGGGPGTAAPPPPAPPQQASPPAVGDGNGGVALTRIGDFEAPVYVTQAPGGGDLYVVEQGGRIRTVSPQGRVRPDPFLDISDKVTDSGEEGLLSVAFPPDYASSGRFYVYYSDRAADERLVEYRRSAQDPLRADPASARLLLHLDDPFPNHNGGLLLFGPDGDLYLGNGDGGSEGDPRRNGQDTSSLFGKLLRIDPRPSGGRPYSIPAGNRFAPGAAPEVYAYGLRNPWRYSFDRATGELWIGDVGQDRFEEIDRAPGPASGANYGWSAFEGRARYNRDQRAPGAVPPFLVYGRDRGCSVTGGYVVRDPALRTLYGRYLYADFCAGQLRSFAPAASGPQGDRPLGLEVPSVSSFGEVRSGRIYVVSLDGPVYRLDPK
jgi:glucose/arabinose dehydrogenase